MEREVEPLENYDEEKHLRAVEEGKTEEYENEYHLVERGMDLPKPFMELGEFEQRMVILYVDKDYIEPNSEKKTENNAFISFLAAYKRQDIVKKIYKTKVEVVGYDREGNERVVETKVIDPEQMDLYIKLKKQASVIWKKWNLKEVSKAIRELVTNDGYKDEEILEQKIIADALSEKRDSFTMQNRRLSVDIKGMKQPMGLQKINVYLTGGGKESNERIVEVTNNPVYDLTPKGISYE